MVRPFRIVRSASVGNRTTYKIEKPHTNIDWDPIHERVSDKKNKAANVSTSPDRDRGKTDDNNEEVFSDTVV